MTVRSDVPFPAGLPLLLAFDLDGTLIPEQGREVPAETASALTRLHALGVKVAIVTGRDTVPPPVLNAARPDAVATNNGGRLLFGDELHTEARFSPADLEAVLAHELEDARLVLFTDGGLFVDLPAGAKPEAWMVARGYRPLNEASREGIQKIGFYHPDVAGHAARLRESHPHLVLTGAQEPYTHFLTVTPSGAHKGAALALIAEELGVPPERAVAFGDSDNDVAMLEVAGYAVQSGALPLLTELAHAQIAGPHALGAYLHALADALEPLAPADG